MNIKEAKEQIQYAIDAYLTKDEDGEYIMPVTAQRPVFVMGAPGIGKTDIMQQIAQELSIGYVSYSMTHHTRQSALGLPYITEKEYNGEKYQVSEYTMSEILSSVYDVVEQDGVTEGILFLDEINCVSETLAPSMLQFLQFKTFGKHQVPPGWVVVTAGNPPQYNNSVREFDIVTWDRLKRVDVEPDLPTWLGYARNSGVHPAIISYLEIKENDFYQVETTIDGKSFVTARGWVDLSRMMRLFDKKNFPINKTLIGQYVQNDEIADSFARYYKMFKKYSIQLDANSIFDGSYSKEFENLVADAPFNEQLAVSYLIVEGLTNQIKKVSKTEMLNTMLVKGLMEMKTAESLEELEKYLKWRKENLEQRRHANSISKEKTNEEKNTIGGFVDMITEFKNNGAVIDVAGYSKKRYIENKKAEKILVADAEQKISNTLEFCHTVFGNSQIFFLVMNNLANDDICGSYLGENGGETFFKYSKELLVENKGNDLLKEIESFIEWDDA